MGIFGKSSSAGDDAGEMSFFEHLDALRPRLVRSALALVLLMIVCFAAKDLLMFIIMGPESAWFPTNRLFAHLADLLSSDVLRINSRSLTLINTTMAGQFNLHLSLAFHAALIFTIPYILWELWGFVKPALTERELRASRLMILWVTLCFLTGVLFGYFVLAPLSVNFLSGYTVSAEIDNMIDIGSYLSLVLSLTFISGIIFLLPVLTDVLARAGLLTAAFMKRYRRHARVVLAAMSAVITPPDAVSMILVLLPMYGLYELSIRIAARRNP